MTTQQFGDLTFQLPERAELFQAGNQNIILLKDSSQNAFDPKNQLGSIQPRAVRGSLREAVKQLVQDHGGQVFVPA